MRPVSSCNSLAAASSSSSSIPMKPPGMAHWFLNGSWPRLMSRSLVAPGVTAKITASTVTIGLGQS